MGKKEGWHYGKEGVVERTSPPQFLFLLRVRERERKDCSIIERLNGADLIMTNRTTTIVITGTGKWILRVL